MTSSIEIIAEMNLKSIIAESREVAQALNEFADNLEQKYARESEEKDEIHRSYQKYVG